MEVVIMKHWAKVVVYPLGLAGFALLVLYLFSRNQSLPSWLAPIAVLLAIGGGVLLALLDRVRPSKNPKRESVQQHSKGDMSPNVLTGEGNVRLDYSGGKKPK
jgi:peptidoglycan/LPS O-acetylase OafA/YrhL